MKVIEMNEGVKIPYEVNGNKITFNDEIMLNLEKKEADADVHIDISTDDFGGLITGIGRDYVAQIDIPARAYEEIESEDAENAEGTDNTGDSPAMSGGNTIRVPVPFSMDRVALSLFALREGVIENG